MQYIFHEKQEGSLCAQHCLNALLQGNYYTAVDLAAIGQQMDEEERCRMAEGGENNEEYNKFLQQPSGNVDDSGYFSVQVLSSALRVWGLELVPFTSQDHRAKSAREDPISQSAYICNYQNHWLTVRKLGYQWFNLNSLLSGPQLISDTYLSIFLAQLQQEKYSIFVVCGTLPQCEADQILRLIPVAPTYTPPQKSKFQQQQSPSPTSEDVQLRKALEASLEETDSTEPDTHLHNGLSWRSEYGQERRNSKDPVHVVDLTSDPEVVDLTNATNDLDDAGLTEQEMLEMALKMSMEAI